MNSRSRIRSAVTLLLAMSMMQAGCSQQASNDENRAPLTTRQRDSTLAKTGLPGSKVVGRAMQVADSAAARSSRPLPDSP